MNLTEQNGTIEGSAVRGAGTSSPVHGSATHAGCALSGMPFRTGCQYEHELRCSVAGDTLTFTAAEPCGVPTRSLTLTRSPVKLVLPGTSARAESVVVSKTLPRATFVTRPYSNQIGDLWHWDHPSSTLSKLGATVGQNEFHPAVIGTQDGARVAFLRGSVNCVRAELRAWSMGDADSRVLTPLTTCDGDFALFSGLGKRMAYLADVAENNRGQLNVYDFATGQAIPVFDGVSNQLSTGTWFSADERFLAYVFISPDLTVRFETLHIFDIEQRIDRAVGGVSELTVSSDRKHVAYVTQDGKVMSWTFAHNRAEALGTGIVGETGIRFSPDSRWLAFLDSTGALRLRDLERASTRTVTGAGTCFTEFGVQPPSEVRGSQYAAGYFDPSGTYLAFRADTVGGCIKHGYGFGCYNLETGVIAQEKLTSFSPRMRAVGPNCRLAFDVVDVASLQVFSPATGIVPLTGVTEPIERLAFTYDGSHLLTLTANATYTFDFASRQLKRALETSRLLGLAPGSRRGLFYRSNGQLPSPELIAYDFASDVRIVEQTADEWALSRSGRRATFRHASWDDWSAATLWAYDLDTGKSSLVDPVPASAPFELSDTLVLYKAPDGLCSASL